MIGRPRRTRRPPIRWLGLVTAIAACSEQLQPTSGTTDVVIQALLVPEAPRQTAWVEWSTPADSEYTGEPRPLPATDVRLELLLPTAERIPFSPHPTLPGRFDAEIRVQPGATYRLAGVVAGRSVTAEATVPLQLEITEPAEDTVTIPLSGCAPVCRIPFRWSAPGAEMYAYQFRWPAEPGRLVAGVQRDTSGLLEVIFARPGTAELTVIAYETNAAAFLAASTAGSSVHGAFGMFGAATIATRVFVWE